MPDTKISGFPAATSLATGDAVPVVQGGADKKADYTLFGYAPVSASIFVDVNGSDTTGIRGRRDKPFLTIAAAVAVAVAGDVILLGPGGFSASSEIVLPNQASLFGSGLDVTTITSTAGAGVPSISLGNSSILTDLTVNSTPGTPIGNYGAQDFIDAMIFRCKLIGSIDTFKFSRATPVTTLKVYDTIGISAYDIVAASNGGVYEFFNCDFQSTATGSNPARNLTSLNSGPIIRAYGCKLGAYASIVENFPIRVDGGRIEAYNCRLERDDLGGYDLYRTGGVLAVNGVVRGDGKPLSTFGTITYLGSYPEAAENLITSGGAIPEPVFGQDGEYLTVG